METLKIICVMTEITTLVMKATTTLIITTVIKTYYRTMEPCASAKKNTRWLRSLLTRRARDSRLNHVALLYFWTPSSYFVLFLPITSLVLKTAAQHVFGVNQHSSMINRKTLSFLDVADSILLLKRRV